MEKKGKIILGVLWGLIVGAMPGAAYELPDTGITKCYDAASEITCPSPGEAFYGQDAQYSGAQPSYKDNGDGTVTDLNTGFMWQQGDTQNANGRTWQDACDYCDGLTFPSGSYSDWRLPNRHELASIVFYGQSNPTINTTYFPNCLTVHYWSSTSPEDMAGAAWDIDFRNGWMESQNKTSELYVRCVRSGPAPTTTYKDNGDGTISDSATGLMWQKSDSQNDAGGRSWEEALSYCEALTLPSGGYSDWRLPNVRELDALVNANHTPPIDPLFSCRSDWYWSSSTYLEPGMAPPPAAGPGADPPPDPSGNSAWRVYFLDGTMNENNKLSPNYVRCVRGGPGGTSDRYVKKECGGLTSCYESIQAALDAANAGDSIMVAGDYYEAPTWAKYGTVTISGGWDDDFESNESGTTKMYAPNVTGGGGVKVAPNVTIVAP